MPFSTPRPRRRLNTRAATTRRVGKVIGTSAVALTATTAVIVTSTLTGTAEVPSGYSEVARDGFSRTLSGQWGSAEVGGSYKISGAPSSVSTSGGTGVVKLNQGKEFAATLGSVSVRDVDISDKSKITGATTYDVLHGWAVRRQSDGSHYNVRLRFSASGKSTLGVTRRNGGSSTWLGGVTLPTALRAGQTIRGGVQVTGTSPVTDQGPGLGRRSHQARLAAEPLRFELFSDPGQRLGRAAGLRASREQSAHHHPGRCVRRWRQRGGRSGPGRRPSPAAEPTSTGGRGSGAIGSASYSIPAGAVFVDVARGSNSNSGTQASPLKTIQAGLDKAAAGKTVVVRAGTYHESVSSGRTVTLQNYPGEAVWLDGSVKIANWSKSGTTWVTSGWKAKFSSSMGGDAAFKSRFIGTNPMAADPDQVFVNGVALKQVSSAAAVTAGKF